jgi:hypothetical protein
MDRENWIAVYAHRLQEQWRTVDPELLEVAVNLRADVMLREVAPDVAAVAWLQPSQRSGSVMTSAS